MKVRLLMGNEAIALGAIRAGVKVVAGYPGTPSTEVLETIAKNNENLYVEWSINEKVALEVAAGAAYAGVRSLVTMKQVGLNVASDPLMSLAYIGVKGGMVILVADDPGPVSSQTEQDTRHFAQFAHLPIFDPTTPEEAYEMIGEAFALSEKYNTPVIFRPTTNVCHSCSSVSMDEHKYDYDIEGFTKDSKWVIFPQLSYKNHLRIIENEYKIANEFSELKYNKLTGSGLKGIITGGVSYTYVQEILSSMEEVKVLKIATPHPWPEKLVLEFLNGIEEVLSIEELDPILEQALLVTIGKHNLNIKVHGKISGATNIAGSNNHEIVDRAIKKFLNVSVVEEKEYIKPDLPIRPPVLCAGCPHRASFYNVKIAAEKFQEKTVFTGDIGCYTLGNAKPLEMVDTCLCMGAGITIAQGLQRAENTAKQIAFIGDSTFFHTGISGIINAVYNQTDITVIIVDNSTTAMTGNQPHPGTGKTMMGDVTEKINISKVLEGCNVQFIKRANPFRHREAVGIVSEAIAFKGVAVVIFEAPCIALYKPKIKMKVNENCTGCKKCINEIGCPAISINRATDKVIIDHHLCYGCGLCVQICEFKAIRGEKNEI